MFVLASLLRQVIISWGRAELLLFFFNERSDVGDFKALGHPKEGVYLSLNQLSICILSSLSSLLLRHKVRSEECVREFVLGTEIHSTLLLKHNLVFFV